MKRALIVLLAAGVALSACGGAAGQTSAERTAIRLPMGFIPNIQYAPFYVALERGYFAEAGFEIDFDYSFETDGVALVGAEELPFAIVSAEQVLLAREQEIPVVYVAAWFQEFPVAAVSKADSGINTPADLAGRKIGIPGLFGASYIGLRALLNAGGLTEADVTLDSIGFNQVEALAADQDEVVIGYITNEPLQLIAQGYDVQVIAVADHLHLPANGIITNEAYLADNPEAVGAFIDAFLRGLADTIEDPEGAYAISLEYVEGLGEADRAVQMEVLRLSIELWRAEPLGNIDRASWENLQDVLLDMGLLNAPLDLDAAVSNGFIE